MDDSSYFFSVKEAPFMHDPIHHNLLDDCEEQRVMCMITYDDFYWIVNSVNLISALIIIFMVVRPKTTVNKEKTYEQHVFEQL